MEPSTNLRKRLAQLLRSSLASSGGCSRSIASSVEEPIFVSSSFRRLPKQELRLTESGLHYHAGTEHDGRTCPPASPASPPPPPPKPINKIDPKGKSKLYANPYGFTTSSDDDLFTSDFDEEEGDQPRCRPHLVDTETIFSSRSFSSDSSDLYYYYHSSSSRRTHRHRHHRRRRPRSRKRRGSESGVCSSSRTSTIDGGFQPLVSLETELAKKDNRGGGFAVVKETSDPYGDFRSSMLEMIMERQLFGSDELEGLLKSYLCLNSTRHHEVIVSVFSDICHTLFTFT